MNPSKTGLETKLSKAEQKVKELKKKISELRQEKRKDKCRIGQLEKSRDKWKGKAMGRSTTQTVDNKPITPFCSGPTPAGHHYSAALISFCINLRVEAGCSYEGVVKVLKLMQDQGLIYGRIPCHNSVKNWVEKFGVSLLESPMKSESNSVLIVDEITGRGPERLLLFLSAPHQSLGGLDYRSVEVLHMEARLQWSSETIAPILKSLQAQYLHNCPPESVYLLSDGDQKLRKAAQIAGIAHQLDISHFLANSLKKAFDKDPAYQAFRKALACWRAYSVCSPKSLLSPPKQRKKARFMNQQKLIDWYYQLVNIWNQLDASLQAFFKDYAQHKTVVQALDKALKAAHQIKELMLKKGLHPKSRKKSQQILGRLKHLNCPYLNRFIKEMMKYFKEPDHKYSKRTQVCSDIIESLFGTYKNITADNPMAYIGPVCLQIPLYTLSREQRKGLIQTALEKVSCRKLKQWKSKYLTENQITKKRNLLQK